MKLYHNPKSRSTRPNWLIEELGLDVERVMIAFDKGEHRAPDYLAINPLGQLPALEDDGAILTESGAICLYLTDAYGPQLKPEKRADLAAYHRWIAYVAGTLEPRAMGIYAAGDDADRRAAAKEKLDHAVQIVADAFGEGPWLLGAQFTTADVVLGSTLLWMQMMQMIEPPPVLGAWMGRLAQRPAFQRAFGQPGS